MNIQNITSLNPLASVSNTTTQGQDVTSQANFLETLRDASSAKEPQSDSELREAFHSFVGQTLFGQMLKSMHSTVGKAPYFHGGQTEEIFTQQLDEVLAEELTKSSAAQYADPMYELFQLNRRS